MTFDEDMRKPGPDSGGHPWLALAIWVAVSVVALLLLGCSAGASQVPTPSEAHPAASLADGLRGAPQLAAEEEEGPGSLHPSGKSGARLWQTGEVGPRRPARVGGGGGAPQLAGARRSGVWAYAQPAHGAGYLAIPEGPGWIVWICGPLDCFERMSTDAGPELWLQKPPHSRIGDLSAVMFQRACGSLSAGLCRGSYEILGAADQSGDDPPEHPDDTRMRLESMDLPQTDTDQRGTP